MTQNTWRHSDVLRLSHPKGLDETLVKFALSGAVTEDSPQIIRAFGEAQSAKTVEDAMRILKFSKNLPWEAFPTAMHKEPLFWKTLFYNGALSGTALLRNLVRLSRLDAFDDLKFAGDVAKALTDPEMLAKARIHPINVLNALVTYNEGQVDRRGGYSWSWVQSRNKNWETNSKISRALNKAFELSFKTITPANKRTLIGLDVSGSMSAMATGLDLSCAQVGAALSMTLARTEPYSKVMGFASNFRDLGITEDMSFNQIVQKTSNLSFGGTDCALPMLYALKHRIEVETFIVVTDNETWAGSMKPSQALAEYRKETGIPARLAVLGLEANEFTIADKDDPGQLDFVGFDSAAPAVLADFSAGRI